MDISNMKNIIVLKNLPSNLVDEAIVILKENKKVKRPELAENKKQKFYNEKDIVQGRKDDFLIKEAENVISDYISKVEDQDFNGKKKLKKLEEKYKKMKIVSTILGITTLACLIMILF